MDTISALGLILLIAMVLVGGQQGFQAFFEPII